YGQGMLPTTLRPVLVSRALRNEPLHLRGPRGYAQNFVHVRDVAELAAALLSAADAPAVVNGFSDDTPNLVALAELVRLRLGTGSPIIDGTDGTEVPLP